MESRKLRGKNSPVKQTREVNAPKTTPAKPLVVIPRVAILPCRLNIQAGTAATIAKQPLRNRLVTITITTCQIVAVKN